MAGGAGKQIDLRPLVAPVLAERFQQLRGERNVAVARAFPLSDMDDPACAIDVVDLQQRRLPPAHARPIETHREATPLGLLTNLDRATLAAYCQAWG